MVAELGSALISQRYGLTKHLKEDSAAYLKSWLQSLKESPEFIKTTLVDVKKASSIITQKIDGIQMEIDQEQKEAAEQKQAPLKDLGTYDIPEWAVNYLENGDKTNLSDDEVKMVDDFVRDQFPYGFVMNVSWDNPNEFNAYPAFGERKDNALPYKGESPYLSTKTYPVKFLGASSHYDLQEMQIDNDDNLQIENNMTTQYSHYKRL